MDKDAAQNDDSNVIEQPRELCQQLPLMRQATPSTSTAYEPLHPHPPNITEVDAPQPTE